MKTASIFKNGTNQAIRLQKELQSCTAERHNIVISPLPILSFGLVQSAKKASAKHNQIVDEFIARVD